MPLTYSEPDMFTEKMLAAMMDKFHPELSKAGAKIGILMAVAQKNEKGETIGAPLMHGGYPARATIKICNLENRAAGMADALLKIDNANWLTLTADQREALLDHELQHLELKLDSQTKEVVTDDLGRPKFVMRKHDHSFGWFDCVANRHGDNSAEVLQARAFADKHGQIYFGWVTPPQRAVESAAIALDDCIGGKTPLIQKPSASDNATKGPAVKAAKDRYIVRVNEMLIAAGIEATAENALALSKHVMGGDPKALLKAAPLAQIEAWCVAVGELESAVIVNVCRSGAELEEAAA